MKKITLFLLVLSFNLLFSQVGEEIHCYIQDDGSPYSQPETVMPTVLAAPFTGTTNVAFFLCVEKGQNDSVRTDLVIDKIKDNIPDYFNRATHGNYDINVTDVLVKSTNVQSGYSHLFVLPDYIVPYPPTGSSIDTNFVVAPWMVENVFAQADSLYDFNNFDFDNNGIVDYVVFMVIRYAEGWGTGTAGLSINDYYETDDTLASGIKIKIDGRGYLGYSGKKAIIQRLRTTNYDKIISITVHELGHSLFSFPDMEHNASGAYDHYALGQFSPMSMGGFSGRASLYNPYFRISKGWVTPVEIAFPTGSYSFSDFDETGLIYEYALPNYTGVMSNQKIYIAEFKKSEGNRWQENWPLPMNGLESKGIMAIRQIGSGGSYSSKWRLPISIVSAHGKWLWDRTQAILDSNTVPYTHAINLGIEDPLKGLDSLQVKYSYIGYTWNSSTHWWDVTPVYPDRRVGSASCFYSPFQAKDLSFYSNPNANAKLYSPTELYSPSFLSNFKMDNLRIVNNITKVDFTTGVAANVITSNTTLAKGKWHTLKDITVASGVTLTIQEGTELSFKDGAQLIVSGILDINGTSTEKVVFDFVTQSSTAQNGIRISNGASANINHAIIKNAYRGVYVEEDLTLTNSEIFDCQTGLYQYSSSVVSVTNSNIHNNRYGAYLYNSGGNFSENIFATNVIAGVECVSSSSPNFAPGDYPIQSTGYNQFSSNDVGVITTNSYPELGRESCSHLGGNNSFTNSDIAEMEIGGTSMIYAEKNYWGTSTPTLDLFLGATSSNFSYIPYLTTQPSSSSAIKINPDEKEFDKKFTPQLSLANSSSEPLSIATYDKSGYDENWSIEWKLLYARNLIRVHKYNSASDICESVINNYPDSSLSYYALHLFRRANIKGENKTYFKKFVNNKAKLKTKKQLYGYAELLLIMDEKENKVLILNNLKEKYKNTPIVESILFNGFMYYLNEKKDLKQANLVSDELGKLFPNSKYYISSQHQLGNDVKKSLEPQLTKDGATKETLEIPKSYELRGNYPNPFNPSTTISYALPYSSNVELTIYDITGKVVKVFNKNGQSAGYQNIVWNGNSQQGSRVSSGVYFYRFKAVSLERNGKVFEKTAKMLLLK